MNAIVGFFEAHWARPPRSVKRLELVCFHRSFVLMEVCEGVLSTIMVRIIVCIDGLSLKSGNSVKLFDGCSTEASERTENSSLDLCHFSILHSINKGVLCLRCMILQLFGC